jgi:hypothetical protein
MTLKSWSANRWIVPHDTSAEEITDLLSVVDRDLKDAAIKELSADTRMTLAYNAALQLATVALAAEGYRPGRERAHERAIQSLAFTLDANTKTVDALDLARRKRNVSNYNRAGATSRKEADEMYKVAMELRQSARKWLRERHPKLLEE